MTRAFEIAAFGGGQDRSAWPTVCGIFTQCGIFAFRTAQRQPADGGVTPENATPNAKPSSQRRDAA
jgi:hypothetical protein